MKLSKFSRNFWILNSIQMIERLSYWIVVLQMPIYIAQKDVEGGLGWTHIEKGIIYFWWAIVQNLSPLLFGTLADKYGQKRIMFASFFIVIIGFISMGTLHTFYPFLFSTLLLGLGLGMFKSAIQGAISNELNSKNSASGWGTYILLVNLSVFFAPPIAIYLQGIDWTWLFYGSAIIFSVNYLILLLFSQQTIKTTNHNLDFKNYFKLLLQPRIIYFIILVAGFTILYMQFYETLPNYIYDWIDTANFAKKYNLPKFLLSDYGNGLSISFEWLYNINTGLIVLFVLPLSIITKKFSIIKTISLGMIIASVGLALSGLLFEASIVILGFIVYTFGEMIVNPKLTEYFSSISEPDKKSTYLSFLSLSWTIGLAGGGLIGGYLYHHFGDKANLAQKYLNDVLNINHNNPSTAFEILKQKTGFTNSNLTNLLADKYNPETFWIIFILIGILASLGMLIYNKVFYKIKLSNEKL